MACASSLRAVRLVGFAVLVAAAFADLRVASPQALATSFRVLWRSKFMGHKGEGFSLEGTRLSVVVGTAPLVPGRVSCDVFRDTLVVVDSKAAGPWLRHDELSTALAVQECGARGLVISARGTEDVPALMGFDIYSSDPDCCKARGHEVAIAVLAVWYEDVQDAFEAAARGENVTCVIDFVNTNPWESVYHHPAFVLFGRALLATANAVLVLIAGRAVVLHTRALLRTRRKGRAHTIFDANRPLILLALATQISGGMIRTVYCAMGPFVSDAALTWRDNMVLVNLSMPIQLPVICVVSLLFRRMISVRRNTRPPRRRFVAVVGALCVTVFAMEFIGGYGRGTGRNTMFFLQLSVMCGLVVVAGSTVLFLAGGLPFLWRLHRFAKRNTANQRTSNSRAIRAKFARSVVYGSVGLIVQLGCAVYIAMFPRFMYSPVGWCAGFSTYYWGITVTAYFHTFALAPLVRLRVLASRLRHLAAARSAPAPVAFAQWAENSNQSGIRQHKSHSGQQPPEGQEDQRSLSAQHSVREHGPEQGNRNSNHNSDHHDDDGEWSEGDMMDDTLMLVEEDEAREHEGSGARRLRPRESWHSLREHAARVSGRLSRRNLPVPNNPNVLNSPDVSNISHMSNASNNPDVNDPNPNNPDPNDNNPHVNDPNNPNISNPSLRGTFIE